MTRRVRLIFYSLVAVSAGICVGSTACCAVVFFVSRGPGGLVVAIPAADQAWAIVKLYSPWIVLSALLPAAWLGWRLLIYLLGILSWGSE